MSSRFYVVRDTREKEGQGWWYAENDYCFGTENYKLDTGDYSIKGMEDVVAFERKGSITELANNITQKRFTNELERLESFKYKYLVLEFNLDKILSFPHGSGIPSSKLKYIRVSNKFFMKRIAQIQVQYNVPILFCNNSDDAKWMVMTLMKEIYKNEH